MTRLLLAGALLALGAQDGPETIDGTVQGADGEAVAGVPVMLHRMSEAGGGLLATDTTDEAGRFRLVLTEGRRGAVHFAAASVDGRLFVGPVLGPDAPIPQPYPIRTRPDVPSGSIVLEDGSVLGPDAFGAAAPAREIPPPPPDDRRAAALALLGASALLAGVALLARDRSRSRARRRAVIELAELRTQGSGAAAEARRDELRERLHALRPR